MPSPRQKAVTPTIHLPLARTAPAVRPGPGMLEYDLALQYVQQSMAQEREMKVLEERLRERVKRNESLELEREQRWKGQLAPEAVLSYEEMQGSRTPKSIAPSIHSVVAESIKEDVAVERDGISGTTPTLVSPNGTEEFGDDTPLAMKSRASFTLPTNVVPPPPSPGLVPLSAENLMRKASSGKPLPILAAAPPRDQTGACVVVLHSPTTISRPSSLCSDESKATATTATTTKSEADKPRKKRVLGAKDEIPLPVPAVLRKKVLQYEKAHPEEAPMRVFALGRISESDETDSIQTLSRRSSLSIASSLPKTPERDMPALRPLASTRSLSVDSAPAYPSKFNTSPVPRPSISSDITMIPDDFNFSRGAMLFLLGFILPPLWWCGALLRVGPSDDAGRTCHPKEDSYAWIEKRMSQRPGFTPYLAPSSPVNAETRIAREMDARREAREIRWRRINRWMSVVSIVWITALVGLFIWWWHIQPVPMTGGGTGGKK